MTYSLRRQILQFLFVLITDHTCPCPTYQCIKFVVPSIGSIIHVGLSVNGPFLPAALDSSPINLTKEKQNKKHKIINVKKM